MEKRDNALTCLLYTSGFDVVFENAKALPGYLSMTEFRPGGGDAAPYGALTIFSTLAWGLGYFGMPHILLRFMAIRDPKQLKLSRRVATVWVVISDGYKRQGVGRIQQLRRLAVLNRIDVQPVDGRRVVADADEQLHAAVAV